MHKTLLFVSAAATLLAASCTQDKPAAVDAATTPSADTAVVVDNAVDTTTYRTDADRLANRIAEDLKLTDTVVVTRIEKTYYTRGRRLGEIETSYATDTTGRYAAIRQVNDDTDREVKTIVTDPNQYNTYSSNRGTYYAGTPYTVTETRVVEEERSAPSRRSGPSIVKYDKKKNGETKIVYSNGTTVKIDKDGDRKTEYSNGTKVKRDADDGKVKVKD
ncbi:T-complex 10 C-terminal domain-containing protein [Hymenobacter yonginensis]|uniref:T-complex 10 C-terminal domain-containing protein n=1 Tax=Hymenobacter yonginensis TaxID=748197 RepID=A0ABY7PM27_9BACT|nr:T-complex 10 C-terminal domain-containing protein [Hymenobacter yonginensis]WBO83761.1 T-complex 10 C-terminal domain-containing protein [Hymenobacter yonginensis]